MTDHGIALFANQHGLQSIIPPRPITHFVYKCDKRYHIDSLLPLYEHHDQYGIVLVSGSGCYIYVVEQRRARLIDKITVSLQSRQKKGGQSALRIARLAEEKRHLYLMQIVEKLNQCYVDDNQPIIKGWIIAGPSEMKNTLAHCDLLDYRLKPLLLSTLTVDTITDGTIHDIVALNLFNTKQLSDEEQLCQRIVNGIHHGDMVYGHDEVDYYLQQNNCACLYKHDSVTSDLTHDNQVIIHTNDRYGIEFCQFGGISLQPYYKMNDI